MKDFDVTGDGKNEAWPKVPVGNRPPARTKDGLPYELRIKLLYSSTGLYVSLKEPTKS